MVELLRGSMLTFDLSSLGLIPDPTIKCQPGVSREGRVGHPSVGERSVQYGTYSWDAGVAAFAAGGP